MQENSSIGFLSDATADDVTDRHRHVPLTLHLSERAKGVRSFTALGDREDQRRLIHRRIAIAKFTGVFDFDWNLSDVFKQILSH